MLTPCPTDDRKMQLFANFVLVFLKISGFCNTFSLLFFKFFCFSVNNTPCTHKGQTVRCVLATFHCLRYRRLRPSKALQTFFTSQLIVGNIVVGQKPRYSTPTSSISFILGLEILYFKILPSLSQETTSMSRKIRNWWETVV